MCLTSSPTPWLAYKLQVAGIREQNATGRFPSARVYPPPPPPTMKHGLAETLKYSIGISTAIIPKQEAEQVCREVQVCKGKQPTVCYINVGLHLVGGLRGPLLEHGGGFLGGGR